MNSTHKFHTLMLYLRGKDDYSMNIAYFITPKNEIVTLKSNMSIRQALEKMSYHKYSAVPVLNKLGQYQFTLSEGDILWHLKDKKDLAFETTEKVPISLITRHRETEPVSINATIESLIDCSLNQSFVPVVDDQHIFIGIIKRSDILNYAINQMIFEDKSKVSAVV